MSAVPQIRQPKSALKPQLRVVAQKRSRVASQIVPRVLVFGFLSFSAYLASSLAGNVMLEQARQDGKLAMKRTMAAREYKSALQRQVIALTGTNSINAWAKVNGFVPSQGSPQSSSENSRVALNR